MQRFMDKIKVAIADDHQLFRNGIRMMLEGQDNMDVVCEAPNGKVLLERLPIDKPDIVLLDVEMPELDGAETLAEMRKNFPEIGVIMLTMYAHEEHLLHFLSHGAGAYLLKDSSSDEMVKAIVQVAKEGRYLTLEASKALLHRMNPDESSPPEFSEREKQVLKLICEEKTTPEIAEELFLSPRTVETYRKQLLEKTGVKNTVGLVKYAMERKGIW
ncbi:response regulator transcription factor [Phaeocystidibacter luteus]|uniref:Response regulator transcription factor n=2 Tax=Phaeocystidibacter luteus TaxID=911197 RepID=A0A6N6RKZ8_9FLAO|nr:response regulator transcription factor [Phaeocystidibacter luteus]